jgi:CelD/BcsL family acetyltransferase involved in cellulose biosynthesis
MNSVAADAGLRVTVLEHFEEPALERAQWDRLVAGSTDVVFLTLEWQRLWWQAFGSEEEQMLIVLAERDGDACAIAPMFASDGMLFLIGTDGSDYLDFIGRPDASALSAMIEAARARVSDFAGVGLFHVPRSSSTTALLPAVAERLGLALHCEGEMSAPYADLSDEARVRHLTQRRTLRKAQARMRRLGPVSVRTPERGELDEWLELFLGQHALLWPGEGGLQSDEARAFCRAIVHAGHRGGWLRFTLLECQERPAAFEITLIHGGRHLSYVGSRDRALDAYSPGAVLQAHVVQAALETGARYYDFGLGEEPYKLSDASGVTTVANWFLYPR